MRVSCLLELNDRPSFRQNEIERAETLSLFTQDRLECQMLNSLIIGESSHMFIYFYNVHNVHPVRMATCETRVQNSGRPSAPDPSRQLDGLPSCRANHEACARLTMSYAFFFFFFSLHGSKIPKCVREPPATSAVLHDVRGHLLLPVSTCSLVG